MPNIFVMQSAYLQPVICNVYVFFRFILFPTVFVYGIMIVMMRTSSFRAAYLLRLQVVFFYMKLLDTIGNVIALTDEAGNIKEKYKYSTYGAPVYYYDDKNSKTENALIRDSAFAFQTTEPVKSDSINSNVRLLHNDLPVNGSFQAGADRMQFTFVPVNELPLGDLTLEIGKGIEDDAGNKSEEVISHTFVNDNTDKTIYDKAPPEVVRIDHRAGDFYIGFNEPIDPATITNSVEIKNSLGTVSISISINDDKSLKATPDAPLTYGEKYSLMVKEMVKDRSGKPIEEFLHSFVVQNDDYQVYKKADPNVHTESRIGNNYLFHGRTFEPETGLYYYRHRYYLPRIGRFLQNDPMGYKDSMNMYQAFNQNPVNYVDPMGLRVHPDVVKKYGNFTDAENAVKYQYALIRKQGYSHTYAYNRLLEAGYVKGRNDGFEGGLAFMEYFEFLNRNAGESCLDLIAGTINGVINFGVSLAEGSSYRHRMNAGMVPLKGDEEVRASYSRVQQVTTDYVCEKTGGKKGTFFQFVGEVYVPAAFVGVVNASRKLTMQTVQPNRMINAKMPYSASELALARQRALEKLKNGLQARKQALACKNAAEMAEELCGKIGKHRISTKTASGKRISFDMKGKAHFDKPSQKRLATPHVHVHEYAIHNGHGRLDKNLSICRPATKADVRIFKKIWKKRSN